MSEALLQQLLDREEIKELKANGGERMVHHCHMPEITIESPVQARGTWSLADYVEWSPDPETGGRRGMKGYGRYVETYRKVDGEWKIATVHLSYTRMDPLRPDPLPATIAGGTDLINKNIGLSQNRQARN
jgi:hypothetical protein